MGMRYKLKDRVGPFRIAAGRCAGASFARGEEYDVVPKEHAHLFDCIDVPADDDVAPHAADGESARGIRRRKPAAATAGGE